MGLSSLSTRCLTEKGGLWDYPLFSGALRRSAGPMNGTRCRSTSVRPRYFVLPLTAPAAQRSAEGCVVIGNENAVRIRRICDEDTRVTPYSVLCKCVSQYGEEVALTHRRTPRMGSIEEEPDAGSPFSPRGQEMGGAGPRGTEDALNVKITPSLAGSGHPVSYGVGDGG